MANIGCVSWFAQKLLIGLEVLMLGGKLKKTVGLSYEATELARNRGQIWTQHVQKPLD